jgi:hypothetical protein
MLMYIGVRLIHVILHVPAGVHVVNAKFQPPFVYYVPGDVHEEYVLCAAVCTAQDELLITPP